MASKVLKGLTIKIGGDTSDLFDSLEKVDKKSRSLSSELGQINKALKLDPKNTELLAQKQQVLADAISNTEKKLGTLREAEQQMQEQVEKGEVTVEQYRALRREIIAAEGKLNSYKKAAEETTEAVEDLAKGNKSTAEMLNKTEKEAEEAEQALEDLGADAADLAKNGLTALVGAATAVVGSLVAMAESSREYRTEMGKLDTSFSDAGHTAEAAKETYKELHGVLGDTDQAVEASNHLAKLCKTEEELNEWTDILTGAYATFGASLPVEGLAEAANETARVGQLTGPLTDAINWASEAGADFGVVLKENIDFTELSSKELKKLTESQRAEYDARKKQHEEIEAYNKRVEEAVSAEDKFNIALENCTSEQERQQLITSTLTKLYKGAATQYKITNKEVIRANEATEKWNATMAELGGAVEPVVTDIKEMGIALVEDAKEPLRDLVDYVRTKVLPAISKAGSWVKKNGPLIVSTITGVTAAVVAYKVASKAAALADKGWTIATLAQAAAQKVLNLVMNANPVVLLTTAIVGATAALIAWTIATKDAEKPVDVLTAEERDLMAAADEAAEAFREQKKATDEALGGITSQMGYVSDLAGELRGLADASGKVKDKDQERVQFILNELNEALGTEYTMVDGVIQKYDELTTSINEVIKAKLANSLVEAANADYVAAIQNESAALENLNLKEQDYQQQLSISNEARDNAEQKWKDYNTALSLYGAEGAQAYLWAAVKAQESADKEAGILEEKKTAYDQAAADYGGYYNTIANYEEAQAAVLSGNYEKAVEILAKKGGAYGTYSEKVDKETANVLDTLYKEAIDAGLEAQRTKKNFEKGVDGYTEDMVKEAETNYSKAMDEFANAYADAESVGEDLSEGMTVGAENKRSSLLEKARSLVSGFLAAAREEADSHSPSRKAIKVFEDVGEGAVVGIDNKTEDVERAATDQAAAVLDAYRTQEVNGQKALRSVAERQTAHQTSQQMAAASTHGPMLEQILTAIQKGQVLLLDGDALVGATANRMDNALGRRRDLAAKGAI